MSASAMTHCVSVLVGVESDTAFAFLADGMNQTHWALGSWNRRSHGDNLFSGTSLFDGTELFIRVLPRPELLIVDFETGPSPDVLQHRVQARVIPGETLGHLPSTSVITLTIWRSIGVDDESWDLLGHSFATEVHMIKGRLELGF